ncbi:MAG TPA: ABC transporter ATP-binding protein [Geminicoccaceae bacterium]|nr:ABC transporter ATP-binding protein [Geminicoccaceae bacterium]HRY26745.1 ABC transporter ATP-binding protein [Geminicoccaceae bacterium]
MHEPLLRVDDLHVSFRTPRGVVNAVRGVSFEVGREKVGIVGESGSGKSITGRAVMRLLPPAAEARANRLSFRDIDLLRASEKQMLDIRGGQIGLIMQDPKYSLNPVVRVGDQIAEAYRLHRGGNRKAARASAMAMLEAVKIRDPERVYRLYPHEVSGGMGQRIMIATMLLAEPDLLIADEPTSALDVTVRLEVLSILDELIETRGLGLMFISHDLNLVRAFCDRVLIMYAGRIVEELPAAELEHARHPYTQGLLAALPRIHQRRERLAVLQRDPAWLDGPTYQ